MASVTLTYTTQQAQRVATAMGDHLGLGRDATAAEVKAEVWNYLRLQIVGPYEKRMAEAAAIATADAGLVDLGAVT